MKTTHRREKRCNRSHFRSNHDRRYDQRPEPPQPAPILPRYALRRAFKNYVRDANAWAGFSLRIRPSIWGMT